MKYFISVGRMRTHALHVMDAQVLIDGSVITGNFQNVWSKTHNKVRIFILT